MPAPMEHYQRNLAYKIAAGGVLLLAAILVTACTEHNSFPPEAAESMALAAATSTPVSTFTRTPVPPATATVTSMIFTVTPSATVTNSPTPTKTRRSIEPAAKPTPAPPTQASLAAKVKAYKIDVTLPTYPFRDFLIEQIDPVYNMPILFLNRSEYEASAPTPTPVDYTAVVLENPYLRLTFLPELGGRLYSAVVKATGQEIFYHNPVIKPSRYGGLQPVEANWWLAAGGMEWAYPTQEHGYRWGVPWAYELDQTENGVTITLRDVGPNRVGAEVTVMLADDSAKFTVEPKLINKASTEVPVQFWLNAALALAPGSMSPKTSFVLPAEAVVVHSRGGAGWTLPEAQEEADWPVAGGVDLSDYYQWTDFLGFFVPNIDSPFVGAVNPESALGVVRLIEPGAVPGTKLFAFGKDFAYRDYTDDSSQYFEIWGGVNAGFWPEEDIILDRGETLQWQESWWPVAGLKGITWATSQMAIYLTKEAGRYTLSALVSRPMEGEVVVLADDRPIFTNSFAADPTTLLKWQFASVDGPVQILITDNREVPVLEYAPSYAE